MPNNQLSGYGYDAAGNMTHDSTTNVNYTFDAENRITGAAGYTYTYDADGNRVEKSNGSTGTIYWYMSPGIVAESDLSGNLKSEYVFFDGERVARRDFSGNSTSVSYYFSDHLKTASVITNSAGVVTEDEDYYPWGGELQFVNSDSNHYKFTGKERDSETGLDYFGARYYGNWYGRFLSADWSAKPEAVPYSDLHDPQSLNLYGYVRNVPTSRADVDGHDGCNLQCAVSNVVQYVSVHLGYVAAVEGNVRSQYNARIAETKASQGGTITSAQRDVIKQAARQESTATGRAIADAHEAQTAAARAAKAAAGTLEESAGRTNAAFNAAGRVAKVAGPAGIVLSVGISVANVAKRSRGRKANNRRRRGRGARRSFARGQARGRGRVCLWLAGRAAWWGRRGYRRRLSG